MPVGIGHALAMSITGLPVSGFSSEVMPEVGHAEACGKYRVVTR